MALSFVKDERLWRWVEALWTNGLSDSRTFEADLQYPDRTTEKPKPKDDAKPETEQDEK